MITNFKGFVDKLTAISVKISLFNGYMDIYLLGIFVNSSWDIKIYKNIVKDFSTTLEVWGLKKKYWVKTKVKFKQLLCLYTFYGSLH